MAAYSTYSGNGISLTNFSAQNPLVITPTGTVAQSANGATAVYASSAYAWTIDNQGLIDSSGASTTGIYLGGGGTITNQTSAAIVANASTGVGVMLYHGGSITNQPSGTISAYIGVYALSAPSTIVNAGGIIGNPTSGPGIVLFGGGSVSNQASGTISGVDGIFAGNAPVTLTNGGLITAGYNGVDLHAGGTVINQTAGIINGGNFAIYLREGGAVFNLAGSAIYGADYGIKAVGTAASAVTNLGSIGGGSRAGVGIFTGGNLTNGAGGVISGGDYGILAYSNPATINNFGVVTAQNIAAVVFFANGSLTNQSTGTILGGAYGVAATNQAATLDNYGVVAGAGSSGVLFVYGGSVNNAAGASLFGSYFGVQIKGATRINSVVNAGTIFSTATFTGNGGFDAAGVALMYGGNVVNEASGDIRATWKGVQIGNNSVAQGGTLLNQGFIYASNAYGSTGAAVWIYGPGLISNAATGTIAGGPFGIVSYQQTTVINLGSIGGSEFAFDAVHYGYADRVVVAPGAVFSGLVSGGDPVGATIASTLELASGAHAGTLTGLGSKYVELANVTIDAGASWTLVSDGIGAGYTITDSGSLTNTGSLGSAVTLSAGAILTNTASGTIAGSGVSGVYAGSGATVVNAGSISGTTDALIFASGGANLLAVAPSATFHGVINGGNTIGSPTASTLMLQAGTSAGAIYGLGSQVINFGSIVFGASADWLVSGSAGGLAGAITGFAQGDAIIVTGNTVTGSSYAGGVLTLDEASGSVNLDVTGSFSAGTLRATNIPGGVEVTVNGALPFAPSISGTTANQAASDAAGLTPFAHVTISDQDLHQIETMRVTLSNTANGTWSDPNAAADGSIVNNGTYTVSGSPAAVTAAIDSLVFTPAVHQVTFGQTVTTAFTISDTDTAGLNATDFTTSVIVTDVYLGGNGQSASNANDIQQTLSQGQVVYELDNSRVDLSGNGFAAHAGNLDLLGIAGSGDIASVSGTATAVWIGGNGQTASDANDDQISLAQGGVVTEFDNSRVDIAGNSVAVFAGNQDLLGVAGSGDVVSVSGTASAVWIGGNGQSASNANDDQITLAQSDVVTEFDNSRVDVTGNSVAVFAGNQDLLGVAGSGDTVAVSGTASAVWIGGNGQNASNANDDVISLSLGGIVTEFDNSRVDAFGNGATINAGNTDLLGVTGSGEAVGVFGTATAVWIGGNGQGASNANDDHIAFAQGGVVTEFDNSRLDVSGNGLAVFAGNLDLLGVAGSADNVAVTGTATAVWIGGNGQNASNANDDQISLTQGGVVTEFDNSRIDVSGNAVTVNAGNADLLGLAGSAEFVTVTGTSTAVWIGGNGETASTANTDQITLTQGGVVTEFANSRLTLAGNGATVGLGVSDDLNIILSYSTIGFISSAQDQLTVATSAGSQTMTGFNMAHGDQIDLSQLLSGVTLAHDLSNLGNYVSVSTSGSNTILSLSGYGGSDSVVLIGVTGQTLQSLVNGGAFVLPPH